MSQYIIKKVASPQVINYAWTFVKHNHGNWHCGLSVADMQPNVIRHIGELSEDLLAGRYRPEPMCCRYINQGKGKGQVICLPTVRDQLVQQAILTVLGPLAEATFHNGLGMLNQSAPKLALNRVRDWIKEGYVWVGLAQIADCLENIPHQAVLKNLHQLCGDKALVNVVRLILNSWPTDFRPFKNRGLAQNMLLSGFLCELYLHHHLDKVLQNNHMAWVRFQDEFVILAQDETVAQAALEQVSKRLQKLGLALNPKKTQVVHSSARYKFLGKRLPNTQPRLQWENGSLMLSQFGLSLKSMPAPFLKRVSEIWSTRGNQDDVPFDDTPTQSEKRVGKAQGDNAQTNWQHSSLKTSEWRKRGASWAQ
ncbi:MAG TPA: hypothetical protein EYP59_14115 [Thiotrichaceae bacterium]|nr:hypothetical protein [Thiotrichaceae bacterium]